MGLVKLESLAIDDEDDFRHIGLYADLRGIVLGAKKRALVLARYGVASWDRANFLNLCFWDESTADVLSGAGRLGRRPDARGLASPGPRGAPTQRGGEPAR
jgi:hypothetical protein